MLERLLLAAAIAISPVCALAQQNNNEAVVEHQRSTYRNHDYSLKYLGFKVGDVNVNAKNFEMNDFPNSEEELMQILQHYDASQLETMSFNFQVRDVGKVANAVSSFWDQAAFKTILVNENGTKRPVLSIADLHDGNHTERWITKYDRQNFTVEQTVTRTGQETEHHISTYEESVFRNILDPLAIIHELMTQQPSVNDNSLFAGYFYSPGNSDTNFENLFRVSLGIVQDGEWNGEILLPAGVFLKENSVRVRVQYDKEGTALIPSYNNKLYLKPGDGPFSYTPSWAYTKPN
ncbi:hypothetical protein HZA97_10170 [Candidatus Woesearchaeota archaeon]|nr:hypothetical protein [Candidatus Woesearchaeota archaeon]